MTTPADCSRWQIVLHERGNGEPLCIVLANTRAWRGSDAPQERLPGVDDLLALAQREGLVAAPVLDALATRAARQPGEAAAELAAVLTLREVIHRLFADRANGTAAAVADHRHLAQAWHEACAATRVTLHDGRLVAVASQGFDLAVLRWQAAASAVALLASPLASRVRVCEDDRGCGRLFVDLTRNRSRRYCRSSECGNRARQAAFRARRRAADAERAG
jgi:predicted RNA-binding Zn ribbon-like protein